MATLTDYNNPSFVRFPYPTDRTAWRPFGLPMILVIPHIYEASGYFPDAGVRDVRIYIAEKGKAPVIGHDHVGVFLPDYELYNRNITDSELIDRTISSNNLTYLDKNEVETDAANAEYIEFTTRSGVRDKIKYLSSAVYVDLSDIFLDIEQLPPDQYILVYEAKYSLRTVSSSGELLCIDPTKTVVSRFRFLMNHPGDVMLMMYESTPELYFTSNKKSEDSTIAFYRPFSEILQDVHDEQEFLKRVNWVYDIPPENVPYLGFLLGWDLPYFPQSLDALRRAVIRNIVKLQKLKGSKRAVRELFDLFGFAVNIANVWWTPDGKQFTAPGENNTITDFRISLVGTATTEPMVLDYATSGFEPITVPVINRPSEKSITVRSYLATKNSAAHLVLQQLSNQLSNDFSAFDYPAPDVFTTLDSPVSAVESLSGIVGSTTATIDQTGYISDIIMSGDAPIFKTGLKFDYTPNILNIYPSRYFDYQSEDTVLYVFSTYVYDKITVPDSMLTLQSNRFDITLTDKEGEQVDPSVVLFLIDFLFRIKAFHSLLRKIIIYMLASDTYQVTDYCVGGLVEQSKDVDAGRQQTPPGAIIPNELTGCYEYTPEDYGFRRWDIDYRNRILNDLKIEFNAWKILEPDCAANIRGQDRTTETVEQQSSMSNATRTDSDVPRETLCELDGRNYCYEGRPKDSSQYTEYLPLSESWRFKPCELGLGYGVYYTYPADGFLDNQVINPYLGSSGYNPKYINRLGKLYRNYGRNQSSSLNYSDNFGFDSSNDKSRWLAINRPSLGIQKDNLNFPGHRLPRINALLTDYVDATWKMKPWDFDIQCVCGEVKYPNSLNARLELDSNGNEHLVFDDMQYTLLGNGLLPDIYNLSEHRVGTDTAISSEFDVTHTIYSELSGHPAITLDGITQSIGIIVVPEARFTSALVSGSTIEDYSDGYPATNGYLPDSSSWDVSFFPSSSDPITLANEWDLPSSISSPTLLFTLSSEIMVELSDAYYDLYRHLRLDCGCLRVEAETGSAFTSTIIGCTVAQFISQYGNTDNDQVEVESKIVLRENLGCNSKDLSDPNSSLFDIKQILGSNGWVLSATGSAGPTPWPENGSFIFKDPYDIIYDMEWETIAQYLDIILVIKDPRVWGVSDKAGRLVNREVYRNGIITTIRQVFINTGSGYVLIASGFEQAIGEFKSTYLCNPPFINPFVFNLDNSIQDFAEYAVICGSHWTDPNNITGENVVWVDLSGPGTGEQPLIWVDTFGSSGLTAVCP